MSHKFQQQKGRLAPRRSAWFLFQHKNTKIKVFIHSLLGLLIYITSYCVKTSSKQRRNPRLTLLTKVVEKQLLVQREDHHLQSIIKHWISHEIHPETDIYISLVFFGSEIRRATTVWMVLKPVVNNGISTTNLNWLVGFLNHQQFSSPTKQGSETIPTWSKKNQSPMMSRVAFFRNLNNGFFVLLHSGAEQK